MTDIQVTIQYNLLALHHCLNNLHQQTDDHQSASEDVRKLSADSSVSGTHRKPNLSKSRNRSHLGVALPGAHESVNTRSSIIQAPDIEGQEDGADHSLMNINQSLADLRAKLENLKKVIQNLESQVQIQMQRESYSLSESSSDGTFNQLSSHRHSDSTHEQRRREIREEREAEVKLRSISASVRSDVSIKTMYQQIHLYITIRWSTKLMLLVDGKKFYVWHAYA